ncbi:MAG: hypothetical protein CM1200mP35_05250 [Chloroflexota bacterium]|nr:MAG: hypothetical protein CM1200mP35_05250 [Chloroflexota bacterium]
MNDDSDLIIALEHVSKLYEMGNVIVPALTDASLSIQSGGNGFNRRPVGIWKIHSDECPGLPGCSYFRQIFAQ